MPGTVTRPAHARDWTAATMRSGRTGEAVECSSGASKNFSSLFILASALIFCCTREFFPASIFFNVSSIIVSVVLSSPVTPISTGKTQPALRGSMSIWMIFCLTGSIRVSPFVSLGERRVPQAMMTSAPATTLFAVLCPNAPIMPRASGWISGKALLPALLP